MYVYNLGSGLAGIDRVCYPSCSQVLLLFLSSVLWPVTGYTDW